MDEELQSGHALPARTVRNFSSIPLATARPTRGILADLRGDRRLPMLYYIGTSAALKLLVDETESEALRRHR